MEILISVEVPRSRLTPVEISIVYNNDGSVQNIDWREAIPDIMELNLEELGLEDYESDDDEDWCPPNKVSFDDDEILEYESTDDNSDDY
jgi:hypothetical protein